MAGQCGDKRARIPVFGKQHHEVFIIQLYPFEMLLFIQHVAYEILDRKAKQMLVLNLACRNRLLIPINGDVQHGALLKMLPDAGPFGFFHPSCFIPGRVRVRKPLLPQLIARSRFLLLQGNTQLNVLPFPSGKQNVTVVPSPNLLMTCIP